MTDSLNKLLGEAQDGDLRPQFNPLAAINLVELHGANREALKPVLIDRFLQLKRPIADASASGGPELCLRDAGSFFYLIETLKRVGYTELEQTLCVLLDEFAQLDEASYDELYLWCIVELSRTDPRHVDAYWPQVLALDRRYRGERWRRSAGVHLVEQPYRLTDLLFYFYVIYTLHLFPLEPISEWTTRHKVPGNPTTLGSHLKRLAPRLAEPELAIARWALEELAAAEPNRPAFGDACGLLHRKGGRRTAD
jgi:hypothetical protein